MLDIKYIREHAELVKENLKNRGVVLDLDNLLTLDRDRRAHMAQVEELRAQRNQVSKGKPSEEDIIKMRQVGDQIATLEKELATIEIDYIKLLKAVPNLTHPEVPIGGEGDFKVLATEGKIPKFNFEPKDHEAILLDLGLIDFERGTKVAGNKFFFSKGDLVRLNQSLIQYGIDIVTKHDYELMETPDLAKDEILEGIGFNPRGPETQIYSIDNNDLSLIGTAEITIGGYHANEILDLSKGPKKYVALSHCFRTEAGAYGRTSKGMYRVHQFVKLEMFVFCKPEESEIMHQEILTIEREIANGLGFPYRVIDVASRDLGGPAYRKFDIEAWMVMKGDPASPTGGYGEITSASNCTDFQARRLNIRYRKENGETEFVHTLNGTAINYSSRWPIAVIENFQQKDGSIKIPKVLQKYCGFKEIKSRT
ncbi:MAG: serine--tRNA ligase [bacterium]|nr:serine--tRNA ligase [bacterium]